MNMNIFSRGGIRIISSLCPKSTNYAGPLRTSLQSKQLHQPFARSLVVLSSSSINQHKHLKSTLCSCGCQIHGMHTKGDRELTDFLQDEIASEKKNMAGSVPSRIDDFSIKTEKAQLILTKKFHDEEIKVTLNVNHTVESSSQQEGAEEDLAARPDFEVDIKVGSKVMSVTCQFSPPQGQPAEDEVGEDEFGISEITMYEGEWDEKTYCVSGDILDPVMYDLMMNMLDERGVSNDFARRLSEVCTTYEHTLYVSMLESLQTFIKRK